MLLDRSLEDDAGEDKAGKQEWKRCCVREERSDGSFGVTFEARAQK